MNQPPNTIRKQRLQAMLDKLREAKTVTVSVDPAKEGSDQTVIIEIPAIQTESFNTITDKYGNLITLNGAQSRFVELAVRGNSCVLIGAAGTGKTTCQKAVSQALIRTGKAGILEPGDHKYLPLGGAPGIVFCAFTRRATANIRRNLDLSLQGNCLTIHKLLEYQPVYHEVTSDETGESKTVMRFEATRNAANPLPPSLRVIVLEEASMIGTDLHQEILNACPHNPQIIYLGDIQQLPPVFGSAILGFKLLELPVVELTEVYRQALESPIISLAHRILSGTPIQAKELSDWKKPGQLTLHPWKKKISELDGVNTAGMFFTAAFDNKAYDPEEDMILCPFNKAFGTDEINRKIANHLAHKRGADVYEIQAGFNKFYYSIGDKILYDKLDARIVKIEPNPAYAGPKVQHHSPTMDYWGYDPEAAKYSGISENDFDVDTILAAATSGSEEKVNQCSHRISIIFLDDDRETVLSKAAEVNASALGYCLTVHKSQGSEWRKVFIVLHQSHNTMVQRELLYTAVTRAREELYVICEPDHFVKGIMSQRIIGNTLAEKAEYFKGKKEKEENERLV